MGIASANAYGGGKGNLSISNGAVFDVNGFAVRNNGLNGAGRILNSASTDGSFTFGENDTGGNFRGNFTNTGAGALALTKVGTGTVVLSGQMSGNMGTALTISGGQLTLSNGFANNKSSATELRITGGTLLSQEGASWSGAANSSVSIGYSATNVASLLHVAGGNLDFGGGSFMIGAHAGATGENKFLMTGGSVTQAVNQIRVGANNGGIMEVSGGVVNALAGIQFGSSGVATTWTTNAVFRLTGGEVNLNNQSLVLNAGNVPTSLTNQLILGNGTAGSGSLSNFRRFVTTGASAQAEIHFNGAKVMAGTSAGSDFLNALPGMTTSVKEGGVWVDTGSGSNSVTIAANLLSGAINDGGLIKTGARTLNLSGTNTYTGSTQVKGGTLLVNGSALSSQTVVSAGATLGGSGSLLGVVLDGGTLAPGNSAGLLRATSLDARMGTFLFELGAPTQRGITYDALDISGEVSLSASTLFDFTNPASYAFANGNTFDLIDWGSAQFNDFSSSTLLTALNADVGLSSGLAWDVSTFTTDGKIHVIPEPSSFSLICLAGLGFCLIFRRRKG
jgi:autotransporter-associated beta strand protein